MTMLLRDFDQQLQEGGIADSKVCLQAFPLSIALQFFTLCPNREPVHSRLPNEKLEAQILIGKHVFECFTIRNEKEDKKYIDVDQNMCLCACNYHYL